MTKATISIDAELWQAFRIACLQHQTSASHAITRLIEAQLAAWQRDTQKETDHA